MQKTYTVATFKLSFNDGNEDSLQYKSFISKDTVYRDYLKLGENLSWEEAKTLQRENKRSWIF